MATLELPIYIFYILSIYCFRRINLFLNYKNKIYLKFVILTNLIILILFHEIIKLFIKFALDERKQKQSAIIYNNRWNNISFSVISFIQKLLMCKIIDMLQLFIIQ